MIVQNVTSPGPAVQSDVRVAGAAPKVTQQPLPQPAPEPSPQQVKLAAESINRAVKQSNNSLEFSFDAGSRKLVVRMVDTETGDVIRQIPSEALLAIAESIGQYQKGLLLSQKA